MLSIHAQAPLSDLVFTVGTTVRDAGNNDHSYLMMGSSDVLLLRGKQFAVYGKAGAPASPNSFTLRGNLAQQTDTTAITTLLNQSVVLGQNLTTLANTLNGYLRREPGITNQSLGQKVATLFRVANTNMDAARLVALLAVNHPGVKMALGQAFTEQIAGVTTYEVREVNPANGVAGEVIGRVTITPGSPVVLPAPGRPFQLMTNHPDDDLTIRLRWGTSVELRRISLLNYGFNVWRISRAHAEAAGFHLTPPTLAQLYSNPNILRISDTAVSATKQFSDGVGPGAADDPTDRTTFFIADNNNRLKAGGVPFNDGDQFYYFVTARDILGRDGLVSPGRLSIACRRVPPLAPTDPSVKDEVQVRPLAGDLTTNEQRLRISWEQNTNVTDAVAQYWVYRWPNPTMVFSNDYVPLSNRIGVVTQIAGANRNSFLDDGATAPKTPGLSNFWYTVRAVSLAACDPLLSPHSPPASGVLRMREGPEATTNFALVGSCGIPAVVYGSFFNVPDNTLSDARHHYRFVCDRADPGIAWVTFTVTNAVVNEVFGPIYFPAEGNTVEMDYSYSKLFGDRIWVTCTVGSAYGRTSKPFTQVMNPSAPAARFATRFLAGQMLLTALNSSSPFMSVLNGGQTTCVPALEPTPDSNGVVTMRFNLPLLPVMIQMRTNVQAPWVDVATATPDSTGVYEVSYPNCLIGPLPEFRGCYLELPAAEDCVQHVSHGGAGGAVAPIHVKFGLTRRTREYRLYRQINDGPLTLMSQGGAIFNVLQPNRRIVRIDDAMPVTPARICYYVQLLDEHGNASPMAFIGCKDVKPPQLPTPVLAEPTPAGNTTQPEVSLNWFCPTAGVYRFKVFVERIDQPDKPTGIRGVSLAFSALIPKGTFFTTSLKNAILPIRFSEFHFTKPVGPGFGPGPQFSMNVELEASVPYRISVAAVDAQGSNGPVSQAWEFTWQPPLPRQIVNWPFRDLPPVGVFHAGIQARLMTNMIGQFNDTPVFSRDFPVGVRIGAVESYDGYPVVEDSNRALELWGNFDDAPQLDPNLYLFRRAGGTDMVLPAVLYRQQVTNANFPRVSGALMQVSPLMERIAFRNKNDQFYARREVTDKLIARSGDNEENIPGHPMQQGALDTFGIYLLDAQPVISGATYRYFLVRFKENREMEMIIPAGEVTIP